MLTRTTCPTSRRMYGSSSSRFGSLLIIQVQLAGGARQILQTQFRKRPVVEKDPIKSVSEIRV
jgi:hypothetical protein